MAVDVIIEDARWSGCELERLAGLAIGAVLRHQGLASGAWEVVVLGCDDARIVELNAAFRGRRSATNVLSWPSEERAPALEGAVPEPPRDGPELGDLALAFETCAREAEDGGIALADHVTHLLVHGTLHLLGYDHERDGDGDLMEACEIAILGELGIADPYGA